eukprot:GILJ01007900.1.p1 GENE.GILJ01007900.1~~GILJ01007900.1.p1  ORF type:complete len:162 (+),score=29.22 GILJ01007900.1:50-487(+)
MSKKVYFAGSIRGGREDQKLYLSFISFIQELGFTVLTEHVGDAALQAIGETTDMTLSGDQFIYQRDMAWLQSADMVIAEVTQPSLGVGYELGKAEQFKIPVLCLYRTQEGRRLSAMIRGDSYFEVADYASAEEGQHAIQAFLNKH